jgi:dolichol-phosphate mannosyltransferase
MHKISLILCTLNEESHIEKTIKKIFKVYPKAELVIVDDNSTDNTIKIIKKFKSKNINLIQRKKVRGLASAFVVGMFNAKGNYIGWIDSNMDYVMDKFKSMEKLLDRGYDLVLLSRYIKGGGDQRSFIRVFFSRAFNCFCRLFLTNKIKDFSSGIFLLKKDILKEIVPLGYGYGEFFVEFILNIYLKSFKIKEIPYIQQMDDPNGKSKTLPSLYHFLKLSVVYFIRVLTISFRK